MSEPGRGGMIRAIAFDFDGVLVESVDVKTGAFRSLFAREAPETVERIVAYHLENGGVSRFEKFRVIYRDILRRALPEAEFWQLCERFARLVVDAIVAAPWVQGAQEFLVAHEGRYAFFIVSGTPEAELTEIVRRRGIERFFADVLGAPRTKDALLRDLLARHALAPSELVFVGDTETDRLAARDVGVPFVWRCVSDDIPVLPGFVGPSIASLAQLSGCLPELERTSTIG